MTERGASSEPKGFEPKGSLRDLLSDEEFREILAPFPGDGGGPGEVVLLLGDNPDDAERISAWLLAHGARAQPVLDRYVALDELRSHDYGAFVIAVESLGPEAGHYLERVREARSILRLGFIADPAAALPPWLEEEGTLARRPLDDAALEHLFPWAAFGAAPLAVDPRVIRSYGDDPPAIEPPRRSSSGSSPGGRAPDWLSAVRALLEARRSGSSLLDALRGWAEHEPGCAGWGEVKEQSGTLSLRAGGNDRAALLAALASEIADAPEAPLAPGRRGGFGCLPGEGGWTALWWRDPEIGGRGWERLANLLPLVEELRPAAAGNLPAGSAPRDRLLRLLDSRMHAVRRHGGSLALLLVEPSDPELLLPLVDGLAAQLRGEDWLEIDAGRLWALLDHPDPSVAPAISARLRALSIGPRLRAVGATWRPGGESAVDLALRLEGEIALRPEGQVDWAG